MADCTYVEINLPELNSSWKARGDEIMNYLCEIVGKEIKTEYVQWKSAGPSERISDEHLIIAVDPGVLHSELIITKSEPIHCYAKVFDSSQIAAQADFWANALMLAYERLTLGHSIHDWYAIIGQAKDEGEGVQIVTTMTRVGNLLIHAAKEPYCEDVPTQKMSLGGRTILTTYPLYAEGKSQGFSASSATQDGATDLNLLCALLSLAFAVEWRIRYPLQPFPYPGSPTPSSGHNERFTKNVSELARKEIQVPEWVHKAYTALPDDEVLLNAINAHHSAMSLEDVSTSYALIAYVSSIEGLGAKLDPPQKCDCCDRCDVIKGAKARFDASIDLVCTKEEKKILNHIYNTRSKTAHEGRLYGGERAVGAGSGMNIWNVPQETVFEYVEVRKAREVSTRLIFHYLKELLDKTVVDD